MSIEPIETRYRGYRFRSRLESRWAVFMDALDLSWTYEPEGFYLPDGVRYLPDFKVAGIGWIEIKATMPTDAEAAKMEMVAAGKQTPGYILGGDIPDPEFMYLESGPDDPFWAEAFFPMGGDIVNRDWNYWFCVCPVCGKIGLEYMARGDRVCGGRTHPELSGRDRGHNGNHIRIINALSRARGARFEHGEGS